MTHLVLVLGCHRSGTSLITKSLELLGVSLGDDAEWYGGDNPAGFWESRDILAIDEEVLRRQIACWDTPRFEMRSGRLDALNPHMTDLRSFAQWTLAEKLTKFPLLAVKEPRMCRLLPFWKPVFKAAECEVSVVHVIRHPMAVARSLNKRNYLPISTGLQLWRDHVMRQYADVDPSWPAVTVRYDDFLADPTVSLLRIARRLALSGDFRIPTDLVRPDLRHAIGHDVELSDEIAQLWDGVRQKAAE